MNDIALLLFIFGVLLCIKYLVIRHRYSLGRLPKDFVVDKTLKDNESWFLKTDNG